MPYDLVEDHPQCEIGEIGLVKMENRELVACHPDRGSAIEQIGAIETGKGRDEILTRGKESNMKDGTAHIVAPHGGELKDLDDKGKFGGWGVRFGSPQKHDLEKDFFSKDTDFWLEGGKGRSATLYAHGTDPEIGKNRIGSKWAEITVKDAGVWMETQLKKRNEYEEAIRTLAEEGKLGLSSGTVSHLVQRQKTKEGPEGVTHIKQWPLGLDMSLTPVPAEPRTGIQPLKSVSLPSVKQMLSRIYDLRSIQEGSSSVRVLGESFKEVKQPSEEEITERRRKFQETVNMSASEIEEWAEDDCSDLASENPKQTRDRVIRLLRTDEADWGEKEFEDAGRVISFVSRMKGVEQGDPVREGCPSSRDISLRNWGYDPVSPDKELGVSLEVWRAFAIPNRKASHSELESGDYVRWSSSGGVAYGEVLQIGMGEALDPSTTDRTFDTSEDEPGLLIVLVGREDGEISRRMEDGEEQTVFHRPETVEKVPESEVKVFAVPSGVPIYTKKGENGFANTDQERSASKDLQKLNDFIKEKLRDRNGHQNPSTKGGRGVALEDELESLIQLTE